VHALDSTMALCSPQHALVHTAVHDQYFHTRKKMLYSSKSPVRANG
jgi:hypothetical protein